jgi:hypothetical protein
MARSPSRRNRRLPRRCLDRVAWSRPATCKRRANFNRAFPLPHRAVCRIGQEGGGPWPEKRGPTQRLNRRRHGALTGARTTSSAARRRARLAASSEWHYGCSRTAESAALPILGAHGQPVSAPSDLPWSAAPRAACWRGAFAPAATAFSGRCVLSGSGNCRRLCLSPSEPPRARRTLDRTVFSPFGAKGDPEG